MMPMEKWAARIGALFYIFWGVFHVLAANAVYRLAGQSTGMVRARLHSSRSRIFPSCCSCWCPGSSPGGRALWGLFSG